MQQNGLRLDSLAAILKGAETGKVVVPGKSDSSRLVRRLLAQERPLMPYGGPPLSSAEIDSIRKWIDAGAPGPDSTSPLAPVKAPKHWAYVKPVRPAVPAGEGRRLVPQPDRQLHSRQAGREGLKPSPEADEDDSAAPCLSRSDWTAAISRRKSTPFSPTRARMLMKRLWTVCLLRRTTANAGRVRGSIWRAMPIATAMRKTAAALPGNTAIGSFARSMQNMPFREFTIDQIAGDMLPNPTKDQLIATGFNRNSMLNQEGGIDVERILLVQPGRPREHDRFRLAWLHAWLRAVPQPQVRSVPAEGLLPLPCVLQQ